jgi:hypothetical protein
MLSLRCHSADSCCAQVRLLILDRVSRGDNQPCRTPPPSKTAASFLSPRPNLAIMTAANRLGMTLEGLRRDIGDGVIVATSTPVGVRISREKMIAAPMRLWEHTVIEDALGAGAGAVLPEGAARLVLLRVRVPRYSERDPPLGEAIADGIKRSVMGFTRNLWPT